VDNLAGGETCPSPGKCRLAYVGQNHAARTAKLEVVAVWCRGASTHIPKQRGGSEIKPTMHFSLHCDADRQPQQDRQEVKEGATFMWKFKANAKPQIKYMYIPFCQDQSYYSGSL